MRCSIVIPTYNHCNDLLAPCIESILKHTDLSDTEIIVVANGCTDNTKAYLRDKPVKLVWSDRGLGYTRATNEGIKVANGEYIVLLNNDTELLDQPHNRWIDLLTEPFKDPKVGITGPMKIPCQATGRDFLIFFCACVRKSVIDQVGMLDEIFSPAFNEDVDLCHRIEDAGYTLVQVCPTNEFHPDRYGTIKEMVGTFPIFHKGNETYKGVEGFSDLIARNTKILVDRYGSPHPLICNCLSMNNELDILEMRFTELFGVMDRFVISEGNMTFGGKPKPYHLRDNLGRFTRYLSKVTHFMVDDWPDPSPWSMEHYQRDQCMRALTGCRDNDIIVITDADELPTVEAIRAYDPARGPATLEMDMYYYNMSHKWVEPWRQPKITTYGRLKQTNFWDTIYAPTPYIIPNAGRHLCYFGGVERIIQKIEDGAHQELNTEALKDPEKIRQAVERGTDLFERADMVFVAPTVPTKVQYNLGCGNDHKPGFINVDIRAPHADLKWDLTIDWTFAPDNSVDFVFASNIFEHLPDKMHTMNELYRILKVGGRAELHIPSTDGRGAFQDPTHVSFWNANTWIYFCVGNLYPVLKGTQEAGFNGAFKMISLTEEELDFRIIMTKAVIEKVSV